MNKLLALQIPYHVTDFFRGDTYKYELIKYISPKDNISLYFCDLISEDQLNNYLINRILSRLKEIFNQDYSKVINLLKNNEIGITGSFILENIIGEKYNGDIDFCCNLKYTNAVEDFLKDIIQKLEIDRQEGYPHELHPDTGENIEPYIERVLTAPYDYTDQSIKENDSDYISSRKKIQFIILKNKLKHHDYLERFDFDIVGNLFYYDDGKPKLHIKSLSNIYKKELLLNQNANLLTYRIDKYQARGYKINSKTEGDMRILSLLLESIDKKVFEKDDFKKEKDESGPMYIRIKCDKKLCYLKNYFKKEYRHVHIMNISILIRRSSVEMRNRLSNYPDYRMSDTDIIMLNKVNIPKCKVSKVVIADDVDE